MKNKKNKIKKKKIIPLPKLRAKLIKLWSKVSREINNFTCIYCGAKKEDPNPLNPSTKNKIDCHHALQKYIRNCPLKFDIRNAIVLCAKHHKFDGETSAHKSPIVFYDWFRQNYPDKYNFILKNSHIRVDLDNRLVLSEIEKRLLAKESLDMEKLKQIEKDFPREKKTITTATTTTTTTTEASLSDIIQTIVQNSK